MKYSIVYLLVIVLLSAICASLAGDNHSEIKCPVSKCPTSFCALEKALYETDHNMLKILNIFSPARSTVPSFVRVNYTFQDENKEYSNNCNVSYLWVKGGFLFVQPPTIFQFSSLFFYFTGLYDNDEYTLNLTLPYECRPLIWNGTDCNCHTLEVKSNNSLYSSLALEELTKQLRAYAKYGSPESVEREVGTSSYSICEDRLKNGYYDGHDKTKTDRSVQYEIHVALWLLPFLPLIFITLVGSVIRSVNDKIHFKLVDPDNYSNTAGIVLTGMFISFFVLFCDIMAVYLAISGKHEYDKDHISHSLNITILWVMFGLDLIVCIIPLTVLLYICYEHINEDSNKKDYWIDCCKKDKCCGSCLMNLLFPIIFQAYVYAVFGVQKQNEHFWNKADGTGVPSISQARATSSTSHGPMVTRVGLNNTDSSLTSNLESHESALVSHAGSGASAAHTTPHTNSDTSDTDEVRHKAHNAGPGASAAHTTLDTNSDTDEVRHNARVLWIVSYAAIAPLFTIPSHISFILAAWLTDPPHATSIALAHIGVFLYFFLLFRQCYAINRNFKTDCCCWSLFLPLYPIWASIKYVAIAFCIHPISVCCTFCCKSRFEKCKDNCKDGLNNIHRYLTNKNYLRGENGTEEEATSLLDKRNREPQLKMDNKNHFNTKAFCIAFAWGGVLAGFLAIFLTALLELPISVFHLPSYLLNIFQVLIVVISLLITYKILVSGVPDVHRFMQSVRVAYENDKKNEDKIKETKDRDEIEAGGLMFGELARVVVHKYKDF